MGGRLNNPAFLVARLPLNSHADDPAGGNNGAWVGTQAYVEGHRGRSVGSFDGSSYVDLGNPTALQLGDTPQTIAVWVKTSVAGSDYIYGTRTAGAGGMSLEMNAAGLLNVRIGTSGNNTSNTAINDGIWHFVAAVFTGTSGSITYYCDGRVDGTDPTPSGTYVNTIEKFIGARTGPTSFWNGQLAEMSIYNVGLTQDEVLALYRQGVPKQATIRRTTNDGPDSTLSLQTLIPDATDMSGNGNDGTPTDVKLGDGGVFNGSTSKIDHANLGNVQEVAFVIEPDSTSEKIIQLDAGKSIAVASGSIAYTGLTEVATYVNGAATKTLAAAGKRQTVVCQFNQVAAANVEPGWDGSTYGAFHMWNLTARDRVRSADEVKYEYLAKRKFY